MKKGFRILFLMSCLLLSTGAFAQMVNHWETVVYDSAIWHYHLGTTYPGDGWNLKNFDDSDWPTGKGGIGYGDNDDRTILSEANSVFIRTNFTIANKHKIEAALLQVDYDDGYIAYLNGELIAKINMNVNSVEFDQQSAAPHEAVRYKGFVPESIILDKLLLQSLLVEGNNTLAIEIHNYPDPELDDLSSSAFFFVGINDNSSAYSPVPVWFEPPFKLMSSALPIILINTNDERIVDEPKISADINVIDNESGEINYTTDVRSYSGKIAIETRGESSDFYYPKKSYGFETQDASGNNKDIPLLGLPSDNDWILYAPYSDKTFLKDVLTYTWGKKLGLNASRWRFVELIINDEYKGVYILLEKIKRGKNRVNISKLTAADISGDALTGGYILRIDKPANSSTPWQSGAGSSIAYQYLDPKESELAETQKEYIKKFMYDFESALLSNDFKNSKTGYRKYIDVKSFIDFMIINEISKNVDGYKFSTYMYKDRNSKDSKLHMGPLWDFNISYGNIDYSDSWQISGWLYDEPDRLIGWFNTMMKDDFFKNEFLCQWRKLRTNILSDEKMSGTIDSMATVLNTPHQRDQKRWNTLGIYTWPNRYIGKTYQDEINNFKVWLNARLQWIDENTTGECVPAVDDMSSDINKPNIHPNPSSGSFEIDFAYENKDYNLYVYNSFGSKVFESNTLDVNGFIWSAKDYQGKSVQSGLYVIVVKHANKIMFTRKVIKE